MALATTCADVVTADTGAAEFVSAGICVAYE
jgi:hypothetical protein